MLYTSGDRVWFVDKPNSLCDKPNIEGIVHHSFIGENDQEYVVVSYMWAPLLSKVKEMHYRMLALESIWDDPNGESNFQRLMKNPQYAKNFLNNL